MPRSASVVAILVLLGCGEPFAFDARHIPDRYFLTSVEGEPLPGSHRTTVGHVSFHRGVVVLNGDSTFVDSMHFHVYKPYLWDEDHVHIQTGSWTPAAVPGRVLLNIAGGSGTPEELEVAGRGLSRNYLDAELTYERTGEHR